MKDSKLSVIEPSNGAVVDQYVVKEIKRPSGLAWIDNALWISEFGNDLASAVPAVKSLTQERNTR